MTIPVLILFVMFFAVICPAFLYWFSRYLSDPRTKRPSFIGFPDDGGFSEDSGRFSENGGFPQGGRAELAPASASQRIDAAQERR